MNERTEGISLTISRPRLTICVLNSARPSERSYQTFTLVRHGTLYTVLHNQSNRQTPSNRKIYCEMWNLNTRSMGTPSNNFTSLLLGDSKTPLLAWFHECQLRAGLAALQEPCTPTETLELHHTRTPPEGPHTVDTKSTTSVGREEVRAHVYALRTRLIRGWQEQSTPNTRVGSVSVRHTL